MTTRQATLPDRDCLCAECGATFPPPAIAKCPSCNSRQVRVRDLMQEFGERALTILREREELRWNRMDETDRRYVQSTTTEQIRAAAQFLGLITGDAR